MRVAELARLLNSTPLGEVVKPAALYKHLNAAGMRIGAGPNGKRIDLVRYAAWLYEQPAPAPADRTEPGAVDGAEDEAYERHKARAADRNRRITRSGQDIGQIPPVVDPERKAKALASFRIFCEAYFPQKFDKPWSDDHLAVIEKIEQAVLRGGLFCYAMPRGSGKSSLAEAAALWAALRGTILYVVVIGSDEASAEGILSSIYTELESNDRLFEDFPEVCHPIRCLEGINQRKLRHNGSRVYFRFTHKQIILPTILGSASSDIVIEVAGITGRLRGRKYTRHDGRTVRPQLVLIDDPQTEESANSPSQCLMREKTISGAVLGMAGPGQKIAGLMTVTVVRADDMADRALDRQKHPEWQGVRTKLIYDFPQNQDLWETYAKLRRDGFRKGDDGREATAFYKKNKPAMDAGARPAWLARYNNDELSAIQHAMNLRIDRGDESFFAEYQNEPLRIETADTSKQTRDVIAAKVNGLANGVAPQNSTMITVHIDVHDALLFYAVGAWAADGFDGGIIDYGTYPPQPKRTFTLRKANPTLMSVAPRGSGKQGAIIHGIEQLEKLLLDREWTREDGSTLRVGQCLVDGGYEFELLTKHARTSRHASILVISKGVGIGAAKKPMSAYDRRPGNRYGLNWLIVASSAKSPGRHVQFDSNYWKTFVHDHFAIAKGDRGALTIFGRKADEHQLFAEHLTNETPVKTYGQGRWVEEWRQPVDRPDQHWFDTVVGAAVAASMLGAVTYGSPLVKKKKIKLSDLRAQRRLQSRGRAA